MSFIILFMMAYISPVEEQETWTPGPAYAKLAYAADAPHVYSEAERAHPVVYLDPGHGGAGKGGAKSAGGRWEAEANLALAEKVKEALERGRCLQARPSPEVRLTRTNDTDVALYERAREAHRVKAACFVSIHYNAPAPGKDPKTVRYRAVYGWNELARPLAEAIAESLTESDGEAASPLETTCRHANFAVTRSPEIPSVLVEADFLTHPDGGKAAYDPVEQRRVADAIAAGIIDYLER